MFIGRPIVLIVFVTLLGAVARDATAREPNTPQPRALVNVFCTVHPELGAVEAPWGDETHAKALADAVADLKRYLGGKKNTLRLVDSATEADVIVEVLNRQVHRGTVRLVLYRISAGDAWFHFVPTPEGFTWRHAAISAAARIDRWIKDNRQRLIRPAGTGPEEVRR